MNTRYIINRIADGVNNTDFQIYDGKIAYQLGSGSEAEIFLYDGDRSIQLTTNAFEDSHVQISDHRVVWQGYDGSDWEIFLYEGGQVQQLTNNSTDDINPDISGARIVWNGETPQGNESSHYNVYLHEGGITRSLTNNDVYYDCDPAISGNFVTWSGWTEHGRDIFLYDGANTKNLSLLKESTNLHDYYPPQISGNQVAWHSNDGVYFYDGTRVNKLPNSNNAVSTSLYGDGYDGVAVSNNQVSWISKEGFNNEEVFLFNGNSTVNLTNADPSQAIRDADLQHQTIVFDGVTQQGSEIFLISESEKRQITDNDFPDVNPKVHNDDIAWIGHPYGGDSSGWGLYLATQVNDLKIRGTKRNDRLIGGAGYDVLVGRKGNDRLYGKDGNDKLKGGRGKNKLFGQEGDDVLIGGRERDKLIGDLGNDRLLGKAGGDRLFGGEGDDVLDGGKSRDRIVTGSGNDIVVLKKKSDFDIVKDFEIGSDMIDVMGMSFRKLSISQKGNSTIIQQDDTDLMKLVGVDASAVTRDVFI